MKLKTWSVWFFFPVLSFCIHTYSFQTVSCFITVIITTINQVYGNCDTPCDKTRVEPKVVTFSVEEDSEDSDKIDLAVKVPKDDDNIPTDPSLTITTMLMMTASTKDVDLCFHDFENDPDPDLEERGIRQYWEQYRERSSHTRKICFTIRRLLDRLRVKRGTDDCNDSESLVSFESLIIVSC